VDYDPLSSVAPTSAAASLAPARNPLEGTDEQLKTFNAKQDELSAKVDTIRADTAARNDKLENFFDQNKPPIYKPPAPYKPPESSSPIEVWGSLAMVFAMLASHFTRTPMMTAMNAGSAVMNAFKQKDLDKATQAYQQWKDANTQALDMAKYESDGDG